MDWRQQRACDVMSPATALLETDDSLADALDTLREAGISGAPVTDGDGRVLGVLSVFDVLACLTNDLNPAEQPGSFFLRGTLDWDAHSEAWARAAAADTRAQQRQVGGWMDCEAVLVGPDALLPDVLGQFLTRKIHRVLVVETERVVGVVSVHDLLRAIAATG